MTRAVRCSVPTTLLLGSSAPLCQEYDVALLDLDGVCFAGEARIEYAAQSVNGARDAGMRLSFVTNNASRDPQAVADKLAANDIRGQASEVFSAAMDGAAILAEQVPQGSPVLVIGGEGLRQAVLEVGMRLVSSADEAPAAVVQGWDRGVDWAMMTEGAYAIANGAIHVATNMDATLPTERGLALGNGSLVTAVANATGRQPICGGKPLSGIYERALARSGGERPLAVGDRLDTDHVGARTSGIPGLHVLTGVSAARDVLLAKAAERPSFLHTDLRGLTQTHPAPEQVLVDQDRWWSVGGSLARVRDGLLEIHGQERVSAEDEVLRVTLDGYRALACAAWEHADANGGSTSGLTVPVLDVLVP